DGGGERASEEEYEALRVLAGLPRFGVDFDEGYLPQEAAMERAVHFQKGCYLGQEAVAMAQRGRVKRRLRHLCFEKTPFIGEIFRMGEQMGRVTSIAAGFSGSEGYGIATIKTSVEVGAEVEVTDASEGNRARAVVLELPGTVEGPKLPSARELRERIQGAAAPRRPER
ncbi:MAG: YgfZ/GcvT domain-containing protein, partial [Actinomycetota bacterium]